MKIDLNCDMGEAPEAIANGAQEEIMPYLTSVNIAGGGHAGDEASIAATVEQAKRHGLAVGAHPGYPDRANFGRLAMEMSPEEIAETVWRQVRSVADAAAQQGMRLRHVKPHGALYNSAAVRRDIAQAIAEGVGRWGREVALVGLAGSVMLEVFREAGFAVAAEAFADRRYEADGSLRARRFEDALIHDPVTAAQQVVEMVERGRVRAVDGTWVPVQAETICIHGDTSGAREIAAAVRQALERHGVQVSGL